jgi:hypothetical protein
MSLSAAWTILQFTRSVPARSQLAQPSAGLGRAHQARVGRACSPWSSDLEKKGALRVETYEQSAMPSVLLRRIDEWLLDDHSYLESTDRCYFLREYTPGGGFEASDTNNLVLNLKKDPKHRGQPAWPYKLRAIDQCATELRQALGKHLGAPSSYRCRRRRSWVTPITMIES